MNLNEQTRMWLGIGLIIIGLLYNGGGIPTPSEKLEKPEEEIVQLVESLSTISDPADSNKLSGTFYAMSEKLENTNLTSNLQVQYFLDFVGKKTIGDELKNGGESKYPEFAPSAANLIAKVIGPQTEEEPLTSEEKKKLARLFYGFAWKLYDADEDSVFEEYKNKAIASIAEYNKEDNPNPDDDDDDCPCGGKEYIIHGDGHKTPCPCVEGGGKCNCKKTSSGGCNCSKGCTCSGEPCNCQTKSVANNPFGFEIPNYSNYSPRVAVRGMTVRYHLVRGAAGQHDPVPAAFVDTLTINQQYWLHDYLHGYTGSGKSSSQKTYSSRRRIFPIFGSGR